MKYLTLRVALLLMGSGFCALVYQVAWFRLFRLVFGASTAASAAVLGIFMAGLGFGSLKLGPRADRSKSPLRMYAHLEAGVAVGAAITPLLIPVVRWVYVSLGGSTSLGLVGGSVVRIFLSALVLAIPTFLMGGTLPAVTRAVERAADEGRRNMGLLYASNTVGAVLGALFANFLALEVLGTTRTLWSAALVNLLVVVIARAQARKLAGAEEAHNASPPPKVAAQDAEGVEPPDDGDRGVEPPDDGDRGVEDASVSEEPKTPAEESRGGEAAPEVAAPPLFILVAAAVVGFAFFLMELVWYRMLAPVLGGSSYTFGLILAVALAGIGIGGFVYGAGAKSRRPTLVAFASTCVLEALFMILPFAMGDDLAVLAVLLRPMGDVGFLWLVVSWILVTTLVVFVPALVAGYQFPLLVGLMGSGERQVGRQVGQVYAWNTIGAIVGSFAGGFGILPLLTAPGAWRGVVVVMLALGGVAVALAVRAGVPTRRVLAPVAVGVVAALLITADGPSAFWRHSPIGAGRVRAPRWTAAQMDMTIAERRRRTLWEADGFESSVAITASNGISVHVNGKSDSNVIMDAPTTVMSGLVPAMLHGAPERALVIGLGTGGTAGWLAEVPTMERVDTVELEEAVVHVAEACNPATHGAVGHERVNLIIADGREVVLTSREQYDVIVSEPSNPYRAGIASLFTQDFYRAVSERLTDDGIYAQWMQAYEVDPQTVRTAYATLATVFPYVETWEVYLNADVLLLASKHPRQHDLSRIARLVEQEPYRSALERTWGVQDVEGLFTGFVATDRLTREIARAEGDNINTDDLTLMEYQFARTVGMASSLLVDEIRRVSIEMGTSRPHVINGTLDWARVQDLRSARSLWGGTRAFVEPLDDPALQARIAARQAYQERRFDEAREQWESQRDEPRNPTDRLMVADLGALAADPRTPERAEALRQEHPVDADLILANYFVMRHDLEAATRHLVRAYEQYREEPWAWTLLVARSFPLARQLAQVYPPAARALFDAFGQPFVVEMYRESRLRARVDMAALADFEGLCVEAFREIEPNPMWDARTLSLRARCYRANNHPLEARARADLERFRSQNPTSFSGGLYESSEDEASVAAPPLPSRPPSPPPRPAETIPANAGDGGAPSHEDGGALPGDASPPRAAAP